MQQVTVRLSSEQARLVWRKIAGWLDAGEGEDGLEGSEKKALQSVEKQIRKQLYPLGEAAR